MHASQEKRTCLFGDDPPSREASEASHRWTPDSATQSGHSGVGAVSSARCQQTDLRDGGSSHLYPAVAVGTAAAPAQITLVDQGEILSVWAREQLGVLCTRGASIRGGARLRS